MADASPFSDSVPSINGPAMDLRRDAPFVLIPCDNRMLGDHPYHVLGRKYADAIHDVAGCLPLLVPTSGIADASRYLDLADGILLTGSPSNVHPTHFGQLLADPSLPLDPDRDAFTLPLVREVVARGIPLLAICRGLQEINVALGGTLHQAVHGHPGRIDHRAPSEVSVEVQYGPAHPVEVTAGGALEQVVGAARFDVNSVHGQGIDRIAPGLLVEAVAQDGQIEAVRIAAHPGFALAVQWHPEWRPATNPVSVKLFSAFGAACRAMREQRGVASPARRAGPGAP
jgi:putative glutamine amidotransferase